ncbi:glycosyltransferase WbuB [Mucilaginibacter phyllosphaerae]|nr:glycosyltransferase WbuB [Mucilaginibacter phyllosphaerae]
MLTTNSSIEKSHRRDIEGIDVIYLKIPYDNKMGMLKRLIAFLKFMFRSTMLAFKEKNVDLVIATSTPLTIGFPALMLKRFKKLPYLFEVRDLWPEVPIQMGGIKNPLIIKMAVAFERAIYKHATHIIALSPGMADGVKSAGVADSKVTMIPNMSKIDEFWPRERNEQLCKDLGLRPESFKLIHFGSLGLANGANTIVDSAILLNNNPDIDILFVGGGSTKDVLESRCVEAGLTNVHFLGKFPMKIMSEIVNFCDVSIVSFMDLPILYTNSPNKLFDSLSAGKPIIVNSAGWTKDLVEQNQCGYYVNPNKPQELVDRLLELSRSPQIIADMGTQSRKLAETKLDKSILCKQFCEVVKSLPVGKTA